MQQSKIGSHLQLFLFICLILIAQFAFSSIWAANTAHVPKHLITTPDSTDASISGFVKDSASGETIIGATIRVQTLKLGAHSNSSGYYSLHLPSDVPMIVEVTSLGYKKVVLNLTLKPDESRRINFTLSEQDVQGNQVLIEADEAKERQEPQVSRVELRPAQIKMLPKAGEADIFRILQLMPGVQTSSEISSGLYIRGGSPDENLILLDGAVLYNPTHFFGFFSTFNPDAIKDVELIKGGFPVEYGGRLSAVLSVTDKDGDMNQTKGSASLGLISSRATIETPVGDGALTLSGRRTYIDVILKATGLEQSLNIPDYHFYDLNGKFTQTLGQNDKLAISGYGGSDNLNYSSGTAGTAIAVDWGNQAGSVLWTHIFSSDLFAKFYATGSHYFSTLNAGLGAAGFSWNNDIRDYSLYGNLDYFYQQEHEIKLGFQATDYRFLFKIQSGTNPPNANFDLTPVYLAGYLQDEWKPTDRIAITGGLRADEISAKSGVNFDPRVSGRYIINADVTLKASVGIYHQYLKLANNPTLSFFDVWLPVDSTQNVSKAVQYVLGVSTVPMEGFTLDVEGYYKTMTNLVEIRPNITSAGKLSDIFFTGDGRAYGMEFFLQKQMGKLTGWLGYTLAWTKRKFPDINNGAEYPPVYDRRNDLDLVLTYQLNDRWTLGSSFTYQTGQAYSQTVADYQQIEPDNAGPLVTINGAYNGLRLPPYHRLDFSGTYSFSLFSDKRNAEFDIDIYNVYDHRNVWISQVDATTNPATINYVRLLPILPTFSISVNF
jgi:outer membrane cobalamin receptor